MKSSTGNIMSLCFTAKGMRELLLTTAGVLACLAAASADPVGGNPVIPRTDTDSAANFCILDSNNPINATGTINQFQVYSANTNGVELVIYDQSATNIVGTSDLEATVPGYNAYTLTTPISVTAGDFVGLYFPNQGSVEFSYNGPENDAIGDLSGSVLYTADSAGFSANFVNSTNRTYSVHVGAVPELSSVLGFGSFALLGGIGLLRRRRAG